MRIYLRAKRRKAFKPRSYPTPTAFYFKVVFNLKLGWDRASFNYWGREMPRIVLPSPFGVRMPFTHTGFDDRILR